MTLSNDLFQSEIGIQSAAVEVLREGAVDPER